MAVQRSRGVLFLGLLLVAAGLAAVLFSLSVFSLSSSSTTSAGPPTLAFEEPEYRDGGVCTSELPCTDSPEALFKCGSGNLIAVLDSEGNHKRFECLVAEAANDQESDLPALITASGGALSMTMGSVATLIWVMRGRQGTPPSLAPELASR